MSGPCIHEHGVFFGLPEDEYHAAFALSASGIRSLRVSTLDWWARSPLNPIKEDIDTDAQLVGRAYHQRILEGRDVFNRHYAAALNPAYYPTAIRTVTELREALLNLGLRPANTARKEALIGLLRAAAPSAQIWDELKESHAAKQAGKILLSAELIARIEYAAAMIEKHPHLSKAFTGGYPEVSIFWMDDGGLPCKARLDYLKTRAVVDLKTFANKRAMPVDKAIAHAIAAEKYHVQAAWYLMAVEAAKGLIRDGRAFGNADSNFLNAVADAEDHTFLFVFWQKGIAPLARGRILPELTLDVGRAEISDAKRIFAEAWKAYGMDPWLDVADVRTFDSTEFPVYLND